MVIATVQDGELRIRTVKSVVAEIQDMLAPYRDQQDGGSEGLIQDRREEAVQEERDDQESLRGNRS